jgi:phospholipid transport system substrate-binding protein
MFQALRKFIAISLLFSFASAPAVAAPQAYQVVQNTTERVMAIVAAADEYVAKDPERYYSQLQVVLDDVVDFSGFARGVMGPYASKRRYTSLTPEGKEQLRAQVDRFTEIIRTGLVRTYGKGLLAFGGSKVEVQRPPKETADMKSISIMQLIYGDDPEPYVIHYQMRRDRDGNWKLRNLIVEAINLGQVYQNQFKASARDLKGEVDAVIDNWTTEDSVDQ